MPALITRSRSYLLPDTDKYVIRISNNAASLGGNVISALQEATFRLQQEIAHFYRGTSTAQLTREYSISIRVDGDFMEQNQIDLEGRIRTGRRRVEENMILPRLQQFVGALRLSNPDDQYWKFEKIKMSTELLNVLLRNELKKYPHIGVHRLYWAWRQKPKSYQ